MTYTSFIRPVPRDAGFGKYSRLELDADAALQKGEPVYVINLQKGQILPRIKGGTVIDMGETIDVVVAGSFAFVRQLLKQLPVPAGIVEYCRQPIEQVHANAYAARDLAAEKGNAYHVHDSPN